MNTDGKHLVINIKRETCGTQVAFREIINIKRGRTTSVHNKPPTLQGPLPQKTQKEGLQKLPPMQLETTNKVAKSGKLI